MRRLPQLPHFVSSAPVWVGTALLAAVPAIVAADYGGTLSWTLWAASIAALLIITLLTPALFGQLEPISWKSQALCLLLLGFAGFGFLQSIPIPQSVLGLFAGGSVDAYSQWLHPLTLVSEDHQRLAESSAKISVDISLTRTASWTTLLVAVFAGVSSVLFADRNRLQLMVILIALTGAVHAGLGMFQILANPDSTVWGIQSIYGGKPFGAFVNRSNAAVMLSIGLAGSIGLIAWRLAALTGATLNGERFPFTELLDVFFDRISGFAIATGTLSTIGLLSCGSRSGLAGIVAGGLLAFGIVQRAHRIRGLVVTLFGIALIVAIVMVNFDLSAVSADRALKTLDNATQSQTIDEARFDHWPDGMAAGLQQPLVGWGWGAYRYAYLPFQQTSGGAWCHNADNLWLEVFVETGLVGISFAATAIFLIVRALLRLDQGADPIDHGLAAMGWFVLGALLVSQFFDFGLKIPANALAAAIVFSAVIARSFSRGATVGEQPQARSPAADRFKLSPNFSSNPDYRNRHRALISPQSVLLIALLAIVTISTATAFHSLALADVAVYQTLQSGPTDERSDLQLTQSHDLLTTAVNAQAPRTDALIQLSQVKLNRARLNAVERLAQTDEYRQKNELLAAVSPAFLRRFTYIDTATADPPESEKPYWMVWKTLGPDFPSIYQSIRSELTEARSAAVASLLASPLSPEARLAIVSLDFAGGNPQQSLELLTQAARLRKQNPRLLIHFGDLAIEMKQYEFAASSWKRAVFISPPQTPIVLRRAQLEPRISANDVIPDSRGALTRALKLELRRRSQDAVLINRGIRILSESVPLAPLDKAAQYRLIGRLHSNRGNFEQAAKSFELASASLPRDADLRFEHANALMLGGKFTEARQAARNGREIAPDDPRFEKIVAKIAERMEQAGR